jgi:hypothetical protein
MTTTKPRRRKSPHGAPLRFILDVALGWTSDECLIWPYARVGKGCGSLRHEGKVVGAHRVVCGLAHGRAPSPAHEAAHSCGRGFDACVNPNHLRWALPRENAADKISHRTDNKGEKHGLSKLTEKDVREIRRLKESVPKAVLSRRFDVSHRTISRVVSGETWGWLT